MRSLNKNQGVSLVAAIAIMVLASILGLVLASMLGITSRGVVDYERSSQAFGLAQAGVNWYMMSLAGITDWDTATNQTGITLGPGTFDVTVSNQAKPLSDATEATRMDIAVTGKVIGTAGTTIQRTMSQRILKLPSAAKFAVYWGRDTGAWLELRNNTVINGDMWSRGTTTVTAGSSVVGGIAYYADTQDVNGTGTYTKQAITSPYPSMPAITSTYYTDLINTYNAQINADTSSTDITQATNLVLAGNTINCRNFYTNGNITISGNGFIVVNQHISLHSRLPDAGTLTISPSGGNIVFLAARNFTVNSTQSDTTVNGNPGIRMYDRSQTTTGQLLTIQNNTTNINGALILANRHILVGSSANLTGSTLFVNNAGSDETNNYLQVTGSGTSVGTVSGPCSLISISRRDPGLIINANASIVGLVYHKDTANTGYTQIDTATIRGSVIANQYTNDRIVASTITYDPDALPDPPPEGFDGFATKKPNSWSGN